jgi:hypothetical protein
MTSTDELELFRLLNDRLERISADSYLAHRASGIRGSMARILEQYDKGEAIDLLLVKHLYGIGYNLLLRAAKEKIGN